jgi:hypothetical protein
MLDEKVTKSELNYQLKDKVSYDEFNTYIKQGGVGNLRQINNQK